MINVQKAFRSCVNTRFTPGAPVQAQEAVDGYGLCRCFCQEPDQGCAKEDAPLSWGAGEQAALTAAVSEVSMVAMSDMSKCAHQPPIILN